MTDRARAFFAWMKSPAGKGALFVALALAFVLDVALERLAMRNPAAWLEALGQALAVLLWVLIALAIAALVAGRLQQKRQARDDS